MQHTLRRWVMPALVALAAVCAFAGQATAAFTYDRVPWHHYANVDYGGPITLGGAVFVHDTTWVDPVAAKVDTTGPFSTLDCDVMSASDYGVTATTNDSLVAGYLVLTADSTVATTVNFKNTTVTLQVNMGQNNGGWMNFNSTAYPMGPDDAVKCMSVPLLTRFLSITNDLGATTGAQLGQPNTIFAPAVRAIITWGTGVSVPACRVYIKKYVKATTIMRQGKDQ